MKKESIIYGVSLGPGDPELITLKGLKILKSVDKIYFPGSLFANGEKSSYSLGILNELPLDANKFEGYYLDMDVERSKVKPVYEETFVKIKKEHEQGLKIAIVSEGDLSTFSSFSYLLEKIQKFELPVELIPGFTSYNLAASENKIPLSLQNERVVILPRVQTVDELENALTNFDTVVLLKISSVKSVLEEVLAKKKWTISYGERLGTKKQFISSNWSDFMHREIPYFSLLIIRK